MTRIDHTGHGHDATPKARKACRAALAPIKVGDAVLITLDDAPSDTPGTVIGIDLNSYFRYGVRSNRSGMVFWVLDSKIRKA
jgi:hypothetical protein